MLGRSAQDVAEVVAAEHVKEVLVISVIPILRLVLARHLTGL